MNDYWDYGGDMPGDGSDLQYGSDIDYGAQPDYVYGSDVETPIDWNQYGGGSDYQFNPDEYLAQQGGYTPPQEPGGLWETLQGMPAAAGSAILKHLQKDPMGTLAQLGTFGAGLYSTMQGNKAREAQLKQLRDIKAQREATLAKYGAVLPLKLERSVLPQGDLLHAGERGGGTQWFTPAQYRPMAEGGAVNSGWLSRLANVLSSRKAAPEVVGAGMAAGAGRDIQNRAYQNYKQLQEMEGSPALPYETWVQLQQPGRGMAHGGALSRLVQGPGDGTSDSVPIRAADGEYVFSAQDVSDLGNGSTEAGAAKLDAMRNRLRLHKRSSPKLAPDSKAPEAYLRGGK